MTDSTDPAAASYLYDPRRRYDLVGVPNFRDVGGYPVEGGGSVRWRTLFRSDSLHWLNSASLAVVSGLGLRTIIDLRTPAEREKEPSPLAGLTTNNPLLTDFENVPAELEGLYEHLIDHCGDQIAAAIGKLCQQDGLPGLVYCGAGKDRTGVVTALTLAAVGVPDELIAADYALSAGYLAATWPEETKALGVSPPKLMLDTLSRVREVAGSPEGYLRAHGVPDGGLERLRSALIQRLSPGAARSRPARSRRRGLTQLGGAVETNAR